MQLVLCRGNTEQEIYPGLILLVHFLISHEGTFESSLELNLLSVIEAGHQCDRVSLELLLDLGFVACQVLDTRVLIL